MQIRKINLDIKRDIQRFVRFPFQLYRDCPQWTPIPDEASSLNHRQHPFYRHSAAEFYLAESKGQILGRIGVLQNQHHNEYQGKKVAFFGFFDVVEDNRVSEALFEAAFDWARRRGCEEIIGPRGLIGSDASGILVQGFEHRAAMGVPYNFPYYSSFVTHAGFVKDTDHLSGWVPGDYQLPERFYRIAEKVMARRGFWIKSFTSKDEMRLWAPRVTAVHAQAFRNNHEYYPLSEAEMHMVVETLISAADPRLIKLVMKEQQVIGFIFAYRDLAAALRKTQGKLLPFGWISLLWAQRHSNRVDVNGVGLLPAYQNLGGNTLLYTELAETIHQFHFEHIEVIQVNETNFTSRSDMESIGVQWYKKHRSYRRKL